MRRQDAGNRAEAQSILEFESTGVKPRLTFSGAGNE